MVKNQLVFEMDNLLDKLEHYDITEEEITEMKEKIKEMDGKLKELKHKTLTISNKTHYKIKKYCTSMNFNIGDWVSKILLEEIEKQNCTEKFEQEDYIEIETKEIIDRYTNSKNSKNLYKTDKLILHKGKPVYNCDIKNVSKFLDEYGAECVVASKRELGNGIYHNLDLEVLLIKSNTI